MRARGRVKSGPHALGREENRPESRERIRNLFPIFFKFLFQMIFKSNLNLIETTQYKTSNAAA